jgi:hypothetical protein
MLRSEKKTVSQEAQGGRGVQKTLAPQARYSLRGSSVSGMMTAHQPIIYLRRRCNGVFFSLTNQRPEAFEDNILDIAL